MSKLYPSNFCPESVLLTGSSGFIGSYVNKLLDYRCTIACRKLNSKSLNSNQVLFSEIVKPNSSLFPKGVEVVIHLAGLAHDYRNSYDEFDKVNHKSTLKLAYNAAKMGVKRFVFVSSISVNGSSTKESPFSITSEVNPLTFSAKSKYAAEQGLKKIAHETGLELVVIRPTLVYGPKAPGNLGKITNLVHMLKFFPFGLVKNKRDFISVQNLSNLLLTCANHPKASGNTFLASDGETVSIKEFTNALAVGINKTLIQLPVPINLLRVASFLIGRTQLVEQLVGNLEVDSSNAFEILGWRAPYTMSQAMASLSESVK